MKTTNILLLSCLFCLLACQKEDTYILPPTTQFTYGNSEVALKWGQMTTKILYKEPLNTPTYASRCLGYIGLAMYESVVHGFPEYRTMVGQLDDLDKLPMPEDGKEYNWNLCLNASQGAVLKHFYPNMSGEKRVSLDSLELAIYRANNLDIEITNRSVEYGKRIAASIIELSKTDGGHEAYKSNFDVNYKFPTGPGMWIPIVSGGQAPVALPMHHTWGKNRTFIKANSKLNYPKPLQYSINKDSEWYKQYMEVYEISLKMTQEQKEIAMWWGDDPNFTMTPPGHSYNLANITIRKAKPNLITATQTYARVGIAVADAFITCWDIKFKYNIERPSTYITAINKKAWTSFFPEPPFPAFTSGHATQSSAAATVLTDIYGENFSFIDDTHKGRPDDMVRQVAYKPRSFTSFWASAEECAMSRLYGQIHTRQDNDTGLQEGKKVGANVNKLKWER
jgi:hypothetical protein